LLKQKGKQFIAQWGDKNWIDYNINLDEYQNNMNAICVDTSANIYVSNGWRSGSAKDFVAKYGKPMNNLVQDSITFPEIYFKTNSATIDESFYSELNKVVEKLSKTNFHSLEVVGYTDNQGTDEFNKKLSEQRAESISAYFESKKIAKEKISMKGLGASNPVADNFTEEGRKRNRRVVIYILKK
jgi:outer membrane protein OmpA-like peptidoglycan-associated protein